MILNIKLKESEEKLIQKYAKLNRISLEDLFKNAVLDKIEDEIDAKVCEEALKEYKRNPITYSYEEVFGKSADEL